MDEGIGNKEPERLTSGSDSNEGGPARAEAPSPGPGLFPRTVGYPAPYPCSEVISRCWHNCHYCVYEYLTE